MEVGAAEADSPARSIWLLTTVTVPAGKMEMMYGLMKATFKKPQSVRGCGFQSPISSGGPGQVIAADLDTLSSASTT
jgi:hypothetical protein